MTGLNRKLASGPASQADYDGSIGLLAVSKQANIIGQHVILPTSSSIDGGNAISAGETSTSIV